MNEYYEIRKVTKQGERKVINISRKSDFKLGDYVLITKVVNKKRGRR